MMTNRTLAAIAALFLSAGIARAAPPTTITYSGYLLDSSGTPVSTPSNLTFRLYDAAADGTLLWEETQTGIVPSASDGYFSVYVGSNVLIPDTVFQNQTWLAVRFGSEAEMAPRIRIASVPSAFVARSVDWTNVQNRPVSSCGGAQPFVTGIDLNGAVTCGAAPSGGAGCAPNQILKWNGSAWACSADVTNTYGAAAPLMLTGSTFSIAAASATADGYLSATDWMTFNNKLSAVAVSGPLSGNGTAGSPITLGAASGATDGYLKAADYAAFSGKLSSVAVTAPITGNGAGTPIAIPPANATASGYLSSSDWTTFNGKVSAVNVASNGGLVVSGTTTPALGLRTDCGLGQTLTYNSALNTWNCTTPNAGTVTSVTATAPLSVATGTTVPLISITQAGASSSGYLSSTDWNSFSSRLSSVTVTAPLSGAGTAGSPLAMSAATTGTSGYLTSTDWNTFNNKQARVSAYCSAGYYMTQIGANGMPTCTSAVGSVSAGQGLTGGTIYNSGTIAVDLAPSSADAGYATSVARADHNHDSRYKNSATQHQIMLMWGTSATDCSSSPYPYRSVEVIPPGTFADNSYWHRTVAVKRIFANTSSSCQTFYLNALFWGAANSYAAFFYGNGIATHISSTGVTRIASVTYTPTVALTVGGSTCTNYLSVTICPSSTDGTIMLDGTEWMEWRIE